MTSNDHVYALHPCILGQNVTYAAIIFSRRESSLLDVLDIKLFLPVGVSVPGLSPTFP